MFFLQLETKVIDAWKSLPVWLINFGTIVI